MKKTVSLFLTLIMFLAAFAGCNSKPIIATPAPTSSVVPTATATPTLTPRTPAPATATPTETPQLTPHPENMHAFGEIRDESGNTVARAMSLVTEDNDVRIVVEKASEKNVYVDFNTNWEFNRRNGKLDIVKVEGGGHLIVANTDNGHFEVILVAYYDGETLKKVDFPFDEYFSADAKDIGARLFSLKWGKGSNFTITPKGGEPVEFTANENNYNAAAYDHTFEDFDKTAKIESVIYWTSFNGFEEGTSNLVMGASLTFDDGQAGDFGSAIIIFAFDTKTTAFTIKNIYYENW